MIRITVELDAFGLGEQITTIGEGIIYNDATGTRHEGNYHGSFVTYGRDDKKYVGRVEGFERQKDIWQLILMMMVHMSEKEEIPEHVRSQLRG